MMPILTQHPSVPNAGTINYTGAATKAGTLLNAGVYTLTATFAPSDTTAYDSSSRSIKYTITKATPTISWPTPAPIYYGTPLSSAQLNATVDQNQGLTVNGVLTSVSRLATSCRSDSNSH